MKRTMPILRILTIVCGLIFFCLFWSCGEKDIHVGMTPITRLPGAVTAWSPDGQWIAIGWYGDPTSVPRGIYLIHPDGTGFRYCLGPVSILDICWSPDGKWLAFAAGQFYGLGEIFKIRLSGDSLTRLTFSGDNVECAWAPSDTILAFGHNGAPGGGIWLMDVKGVSPRFFIAYAGFFDFALGDSLLYIRSINSDSGMIGIINTADSGGRIAYKWKYRKPSTAYGSPKASPDGRLVAVSIDSQIRSIDLLTGANMQLTADGGDSPSWSPDGQFIVYNKPGGDPMGGTIWIMKSDGTDKHILVDWKTAPGTAKHVYFSF